MIPAYSQNYLNDAMSTLGQMTDYGVNDCHVDMKMLLEMFMVTGLAAQFEAGNPKYIVGMSGEELALAVFERAGAGRDFPKAAVMTERTAEYWCGWIQAYCQWKTGYSFAKIFQIIPPDEFMRLYPTMHEAPEDKMVSVLLERKKRSPSRTQLARMRAYAGLSQAELARRSGVSLRSIQMYEQRNKDINKAQAVTVKRLSMALGCTSDDVMEV